jgi:peroxiredoxin
MHLKPFAYLILVMGTSLTTFLPAQEVRGVSADADRHISNAETATAVRQGPRQLRPADYGVGRMIPDVEFRDFAGRQHRLSECTARPLTVVAVTSTSCPISKRYLPTLAKLEKTYKDRDVVFIFVNPTPSDSDADIRAAIDEHGLQGAYVRDADGKLLGLLGAKTTAECFVLDRARTLVWWSRS